MTEGPEITVVETVLDNGKFGKRTVKFEHGLLARQAAGAVTAYLDDETMILSATTAGKHPKDHFDFFPLTIDVEERMYAAGKIPGSFFRSEGRPGEDAILTCRLIDRPLRPTFKKGLRNEVQVVITVLALEPDTPYDVLAINAASASTQISGLPFSGPIGATRVSLIDGQWVAFPNFSDIERSTFDMVVAGRVVGDDVAIMMVEAESTESTWDLVKNEGKQAPTEEVVAQGLEESKKFIKALCEAQAQLATEAAKEVQEFPRFLDYEDDAFTAVEEATSSELAQALQIAGASSIAMALLPGRPLLYNGQERVLKGAAVETLVARSYDGIGIGPLYEAAQGSETPLVGRPGRWHVAQRIGEVTPCRQGQLFSTDVRRESDGRHRFVVYHEDEAKARAQDEERGDGARPMRHVGGPPEADHGRSKSQRS